MKIGILSDTHGVLDKNWNQHFTECDCLIHAGDINTKACYEMFKNVGIPIYMVRGNCDMGSWAAYLPEFLQVPIGGKLFYIIHDKNDLPFDLTDADFVIFGHTHRYTQYERFGKVYLNPGSAGAPRGDVKSMAILQISEDSFHIKRLFL